MDLLARIKATIADQRLMGEESPLLLMVSGGSDSTALAYLACQLRQWALVGPLKILHVNHKLRGEESDEDAEFVEALANFLEVPFCHAAVDVGALCSESGENMEAVARKVRYDAAYRELAKFCQDLAVPEDQGRIAVAHTLDDRAENFYMRSIVGTGPGGFRSMDYKTGPVVRPLLDCTRRELQEYLQRTDAEEAVKFFKGAHGELWREDSTNACTDRFRAFVRHEVLPILAKRNVSHLRTLGRTMNQIAEEDDMLEGWAAQLLDKYGQWNQDDLTWLLLPAIANEPRPLRKRAIAKALARLLMVVAGDQERLEAASVDAVDGAIDGNKIASGYVVNIQGNLAVSANKEGIRIEPMEAFRKRRKKL